MFTARMLRPQMPMPHRRHRKSHAGFTLIEVMVVVAIVGVMAALAVFGVRRLLTAGKAKADADDAMLAMASAIRTYYDRNRGYLDCSTDYDDFYPMTPNGKKHVLNNAGHGAHRWARGGHLLHPIAGWRRTTHVSLCFDGLNRPSQLFCAEH